MKKTAIILAFLLLLSLCTACGTEKGNTDLSSDADLSAAAPEDSAAEAAGTADALSETLSHSTSESPAEEPEAADAGEEAVSSTPDESSPEAEKEVFSWKGYSMTFPFMTVDMAGYGVEDFQDSMVLVRLAAVDGAIAYNDFRQNLFELTDPEGNTHTCKFFIVANTVSSPVIEGMPADQQDYIDMLFEMSDATAEELAASHMNVYEEEGGQPLEVPLKTVPQELEE